MNSSKGFLSPTGPGGPLRITAKHKAAIHLAVREVIKGDPDEEGRRWTEAWVAAALAAYPTDRSCWTCDHEIAGKCSLFDGAEIPREFLEQGCEKHRESGIPF